MSAQTKAQVISDYKISDNDTGSMDVQIALLTARINHLTQHFKTHKHDMGSKRGMLILVGRRRRFLRYLEEHDAQKYKDLVKRLGLRK